MQTTNMKSMHCHHNALTRKCLQPAAAAAAAIPLSRRAACCSTALTAGAGAWAAAIQQHRSQRREPQTQSKTLRSLPSRRQRATATVSCSAAGSSSNSSTILTLPTILTLVRVAAVPAVVAAWFSAAPWAGTACTALFVGASLTDFLDGYLARKMNSSSAFGAFLDPVADKLMVATVMILLCTQPLPLGLLAGNTWLMPVVTCVVIGREITMSALREWAASLGPEAHSAVAVSWVGKWKTATQMASLTLLLLAHQGAAGGVPAGMLAAAGAAGVPLLCVAAVLTAWSLALYFKGLWRFF